MDDMIIKIGPKDYIRMKAIVIDSNCDDALMFVKELLKKTEAFSSRGLKNHLDI